MYTYFSCHECGLFLVDSATDPIEPPWRALAALLRLAGNSPPRCRALPKHPMAAHSGLSNCSF